MALVFLFSFIKSWVFFFSFPFFILFVSVPSGRKMFISRPELSVPKSTSCSLLGQGKMTDFLFLIYLDNYDSRGASITRVTERRNFIIGNVSRMRGVRAGGAVLDDSSVFFFFFPKKNRESRSIQPGKTREASSWPKKRIFPCPGA